MLTCLFLFASNGVAAADDPSWFRPDQFFTYQFPDPSFFEAGPYTIGYSTVHGGAHLPAEWSGDHKNFTPRPQYSNVSGFPYADGDPFYNDAMPNPGPCSTMRTVGGTSRAMASIDSRRP